MQYGKNNTRAWSLDRALVLFFPYCTGGSALTIIYNRLPASNLGTLGTHYTTMKKQYIA